MKITGNENGVDSIFSNYIKILNGLGLTQNMNILIPEAQPDFKALFEKIPSTASKIK